MEVKRIGVRAFGPMGQAPRGFRQACRFTNWWHWTWNKNASYFSLRWLYTTFQYKWHANSWAFELEDTVLTHPASYPMGTRGSFPGGICDCLFCQTCLTVTCTNDFIILSVWVQWYLLLHWDSLSFFSTSKFEASFHKKLPSAAGGVLITETTLILTMLHILSSSTCERDPASYCDVIHVLSHVLSNTLPWSKPMTVGAVTCAVQTDH